MRAGRNAALRSVQGTFVVELTIGLVSVGLSILFYVMAARSQRKLNQVAARINTNASRPGTSFRR